MLLFKSFDKMAAICKTVFLPFTQNHNKKGADIRLHHILIGKKKHHISRFGHKSIVITGLIFTVRDMREIDDIVINNKIV